MAKLDPKTVASQYGYAYAFMTSDPELNSLFNTAVKGNWNQDRFTAALKTTQWYKKNGETSRQYLYLQKTDPATLQSRISQVSAQISAKASQVGAIMDAGTVARISEDALRYGWNDQQISSTLSRYVHATNGMYSGQSADNAEHIRQTAWRNGVRLPEATVQQWIQGIASGTTTLDSTVANLRAQAKSIAPAFAKEIDSGMDLYDIASPYMQTMGKVLELNPSSLDLFDPTIRSALSTKDSNGNPVSKPLWQFENDLRSDPRWLKTQNAQDSMMSAGKKVLSDMGFA